MRTCLAVTIVLMSHVLLAQESGYQKEVTVKQGTRLDWTFALANQSLVEPPAEWLAGYDSTKQRYELYVPGETKPPAKKTSKTTSKSKKTKPASTRNALPLVLFISPGDQPSGWAQWQPVCEQQGIAFASPFDAGNNTPMPKRIRIVLDVLDDLRQRQDIDPDRTYLAGFSGGGRTACGIAFALPELFGGVVPVCAAGDLREEIWLRHRVMDRLSVALITGPDDFNNGEVERFRGPMLAEVGVRTRVTVVPQMGHAIPDPKTFEKVYEWLESGVADRRKLAARHPASRINPQSAPTREELATAFLKEGQSRLTEAKTLYSGLMQLKGVMKRWPDLEQAETAKKLLLEYESKDDHPWEADDIAEQRKFLIARARALSDYATGKLPPQYEKQRPEMLEAAINLWMLIIQDGQDARAVADGEKRLPELRKKLEAEQ